MTNYYNKYLKYKNKYLKLKGGALNIRKNNRKSTKINEKYGGAAMAGNLNQPCWAGITQITDPVEQDGYWRHLQKKIPNEKPIRGIILSAHSSEGYGTTQWTNRLDIPIYIQFFQLNKYVGPIKPNLYDFETEWFREFNELLQNINNPHTNYMAELHNKLMELTQNDRCSASEMPVHLLIPYFIGAGDTVDIPRVDFTVPVHECNLDLHDSGFIIDMDQYDADRRFGRYRGENSSFILDFCNPDDVAEAEAKDSAVSYSLERILDEITTYVTDESNEEEDSIVIFMTSCRGHIEPNLHYASNATAHLPPPARAHLPPPAREGVIVEYSPDAPLCPCENCP